jgi:hypothetical protein
MERVVRAQALPWIAAGLFLLAVLTNCHAASSATLGGNPDRDARGLRRVPLLPTDLQLLRRTAEVRVDWTVPLAADVAQRLIVAGARACWQGVRSNATPGGGALGELTESKATRVVHVEQWPQLRAVAIGLGVTVRSPVIGVNEAGYSVMFAIQAIDDGRSAVYGYRRVDNSVQRRFVALAPAWLSGNTTTCEVE